MPVYPYRVRVLSAIDSLITPKEPTKAIPLSSIGTIVELLLRASRYVVLCC